MGYLRIVRRRVFSDVRRTRGTVLVLTPAGEAALAGNRLSGTDIQWIEAAFANNVLT
jgi:hypothetical protein